MAEWHEDTRKMALEGIKGQGHVETPENDSMGWGMVFGWTMGECEE